MDPLPDNNSANLSDLPVGANKSDRSLLIFDNPEKMNHRPSGSHECLPMWPFRWLLTGPPGSGKRNIYLNIIFRLDPPPSAIHIIHYDPNTIELEILEDLGVPMYYYSYDDIPLSENISDPEEPAIGDSEIPSAIDESGAAAQCDTPDMPTNNGDEPEDIPEDKPNLGECPLVIIDEIIDDLLSPQSRMRLDRLLNYASTHRNCSVICSIQSLISIPSSSRRAFNIFTLWRQADKNSNLLTAQRSGIHPGMLAELFDDLCHDMHDNITIDLTRKIDDPWRIRFNLLCPVKCLEPVSRNDYS